MPLSQLRVEATRGELVESVHPVSAAVVDANDRLLASAGDPDYLTWWRSAAKPFQALPLVDDGAADAFALTDEELALVCASHSSESRHLDVVERLMTKVGVDEQMLACGVHTPLSPAVARAVARGTVILTARSSNCSGKHTGMLALAKHHGWPLQGYHAAGHPVQERVLDEISRWTGEARDRILLAVDGCTAVCFGLPVRRMALAYARLGASTRAGPRRIVGAMMAHPFLVAGTGRLCSDLMAAWPGKIVAKIGADGIYSAALPALGWGIALKVEDGDMGSSGLALVEILRQLLERLAPGETTGFPSAALAGHARQPIRNTRGMVTGEIRPAGALRFSDA